MKYKSHIFRGMFTESLVNKTIDNYIKNNVAYFKKSHAPISVAGNDVLGPICNDQPFVAKADVDYYGLYKGRYIAFEVKETKGAYFSLSEITPHQLESLKLIQQHGGITFLLLNFTDMSDGVWVILTDRLVELFANKVKRVNVNQVSSIGLFVPLEFPGIIDWIKCFIKC